MRLQLPTIIFICLSLIIIVPLIYYMKTNKQIANRESVNLESEEFKSIREQANIAQSANRYSEAIQMYEEAVKMRPENAEVYNDLGATYYQFGLEQAGPNWPSWESDLAGKTPDEALKEFQKATEITISGYIVLKSDNPKVTEAIQSRAKEIGAYVYTEQFGDRTKLNLLIGKTKEFLMKARDAYLRSIDLKPTYSPAYRNLGALYMKIGQYDAAVDNMEHALQLDPRDKKLEQYLEQLK